MTSPESSSSHPDDSPDNVSGTNDGDGQEGGGPPSSSPSSPGAGDGTGAVGGDEDDGQPGGGDGGGGGRSDEGEEIEEEGVSAVEEERDRRVDEDDDDEDDDSSNEEGAAGVGTTDEAETGGAKAAVTHGSSKDDDDDPAVDAEELSEAVASLDDEGSDIGSDDIDGHAGPAEDDDEGAKELLVKASHSKGAPEAAKPDEERDLSAKEDGTASEGEGDGVGGDVASADDAAAVEEDEGDEAAAATSGPNNERSAEPGAAEERDNEEEAFFDCEDDDDDRPAPPMDANDATEEEGREGAQNGDDEVDVTEEGEATRKGHDEVDTADATEGEEEKGEEGGEGNDRGEWKETAKAKAGNGPPSSSLLLSMGPFFAVKRGRLDLGGCIFLSFSHAYPWLRDHDEAVYEAFSDPTEAVRWLSTPSGNDDGEEGDLRDKSWSNEEWFGECVEVLVKKRTLAAEREAARRSEKGGDGDDGAVDEGEGEGGPESWARLSSYAAEAASRSSHDVASVVSPSRRGGRPLGAFVPPVPMMAPPTHPVPPVDPTHHVPMAHAAAPPIPIGGTSPGDVVERARLVMERAKAVATATSHAAQAARARSARDRGPRSGGGGPSPGIGPFPPYPPPPPGGPYVYPHHHHRHPPFILPFPGGAGPNAHPAAAAAGVAGSSSSPSRGQGEESGTEDPAGSEKQKGKKRRRRTTTAQRAIPERWMGMFDRLSKYREKHGTCDVLHPSRVNSAKDEKDDGKNDENENDDDEEEEDDEGEEDEKNERMALYRWVRRQREQYKLLMRGQLASGGKPSTMWDAKIEKLKTLDFDFGYYTIEERIEQLRKYREEEGGHDGAVPSERHGLLGNFVRHCREDFRRRNLGKELKHLTVEEVDMMEELGLFAGMGGRRIGTGGPPPDGAADGPSRDGGMTTDGGDDDDDDEEEGNPRDFDDGGTWSLQPWLTMYERLKQYKRERGTCEVLKEDRKKDAEYMALHSWICRQRVDYKYRREGRASVMSDERIRTLQSIGFDFVHYPFEERLMQLRHYREVLDDETAVPDKNHSLLGRFVRQALQDWRRQRKGKGLRNFDAEQMERLDAVGLFPATKKDAPADGRGTVDSDGEGGPAEGSDDDDDAPPPAKRARKRRPTPAWFANLERLSRHKSEHGTCEVPAIPAEGDDPHRSLRDWTQKQRNHYKLFKEGKPSSMFGEKVEMLRTLGFDFRYYTFDERLEQLRHYREVLDDEETVPNEDHALLGKFVKKAKEDWRLRRRGKELKHFTPEQLEQLDSLGFFKAREKAGVVDSTPANEEGKVNTMTPKGRKRGLNEKWLRTFDKLCSYKAEKGTFDVSKEDHANPEHKYLHNWITRQRYEYRLMKEGRPSGMFDAKIDKLQSIGFDFGYYSFEERMEQLNRFRVMLDDPTAVPKTNHSLLGEFATWAWDDYACRESGKTLRHFTDEQMGLLDAVGFFNIYQDVQPAQPEVRTEVVDAASLVNKNDPPASETRRRKPTQAWMTMFDRLNEYHTRTGLCDVRKEDRDNDEQKDLQDWIVRQRLAYKHFKQGKPSSMFQTKVEKLESLGFDFKYDGTKSPTRKPTPRWYVMFERLRNYRSQNGTCELSKEDREGDYKDLQSFIYRQRLDYRDMKGGKPSLMLDEKVQKLHSIGFDFVHYSFPDRLQQLRHYREVSGNMSAIPPVNHPLLGKFVSEAMDDCRRATEGKELCHFTASNIEKLRSVGFEPQNIQPSVCPMGEANARQWRQPLLLPREPKKVTEGDIFAKKRRARRSINI